MVDAIRAQILPSWSACDTGLKEAQIAHRMERSIPHDAITKKQALQESDRQAHSCRHRLRRR